MKKSLFTVLILSLSLVFAFSAIAQDEDVVSCTKCPDKDCVLPEIACPVEPDPQLQQPTCPPTPIPWECFVFPVCDCPDTEENFKEFVPGEEGGLIGIRMHILTPGVYFAENLTEIDFIAYDSVTDACNEVTDNRDGVFSDILYFDDFTCDPDRAIIPNSSDACSYTTGKAVALATNRLNSDAFFAIPAGWEGYSFWTIEIPDIKIDVDEVLAAGLQGENVQIRIEFVVPGTGGICAGDCLVICECTIEVATLCPEGETQPVSQCIYFPYVFQQALAMTPATNWMTGVVITNTGAVAPADMTATFTMIDTTGAAVTYTKDDFTSPIFVTSLDAILSRFSAMPAPGAAWIKVNTNFQVDGYSFLTDGSFGGSTLARQCSFPCTCVSSN